MTLEEIAVELGLDVDTAQHLGSHLAAKGYLIEEEHEASGGLAHRADLARIRKDLFSWVPVGDRK